MSAEHHVAGPEHKLERLVFFSDAVFAIAITLLVIEIHPPHLAMMASDSAHGQALAKLAPQFLGFLVSFFVIGAFWAGHHRAFALARHWDDRLFGPNLQLLFAIAAMPFFTAYLSGNANSRLPVAVYCGWLILTGLLNRRLMGRVTAPPVVDPAVPEPVAREVRLRGVSVTLSGVLALGLALVIPPPFLAMALMALMAIGPLRKLLSRRLAHG